MQAVTLFSVEINLNMNLNLLFWKLPTTITSKFLMNIFLLPLVMKLSLLIPSVVEGTFI